VEKGDKCVWGNYICGWGWWGRVSDGSAPVVCSLRERDKVERVTKSVDDVALYLGECTRERERGQESGCR
jgi:hypothetical protein